MQKILESYRTLIIKKILNSNGKQTWHIILLVNVHESQICLPSGSCSLYMNLTGIVLITHSSAHWWSLCSFFNISLPKISIGWKADTSEWQNFRFPYKHIAIEKQVLAFSRNWASSAFCRAGPYIFWHENNFLCSFFFVGCVHRVSHYASLWRLNIIFSFLKNFSQDLERFWQTHLPYPILQNWQSVQAFKQAKWKIIIIKRTPGFLVHK